MLYTDIYHTKDFCTDRLPPFFLFLLGYNFFEHCKPLVFLKIHIYFHAPSKGASRQKESLELKFFPKSNHNDMLYIFYHSCEALTKKALARINIRLHFLLLF